MSTQIKDKPIRDNEGYNTTRVEPERALLAGLVLDRPPSPMVPEAPVDGVMEMDELAGLAHAAGAVVVAQVTQKRARPDAATLFGKGKVTEIGELTQQQSADVVIVDHDLSPAQGRNLENALNVRVIDRTELILDIFARRARTRQARLQVELAQLRYQLPRLKRMWTHLERTGGGIGTRGPGETQLETDRNLARERIGLLEKQLEEIRRQKVVESEGRLDYDLGALVGYTNVGKSALLNAISAPTGRGVLVANQLFATLGAATRRVELGGGRTVLLTDTVGFVRHLPHHLVECFHSTLAEVRNAQFLLLVNDAADPELDDKLRAVRRVLDELSVLATPTVLVLNQCDRIDAAERAALLRRFPDGVLTSALTGEGLDTLRERVGEVLEATADDIDLTLDAADPGTGKLLAEIARHGRVLEQDWSGDDGRPRVHVRVRLTRRWSEKLGLAPRSAAAAPLSAAAARRAAM